MKVIAGFVLVSSAVCSSFADDYDPVTAPSHYVQLFYGRSALIFGSEDVRYGGGISYAFGKPEKRFQAYNVPAQLVYEVYADRTQSTGYSGYPGNTTYALGGLGYGRWIFPFDRRGNGIYFDLGLGVQGATEKTLDLESVFNTTPVGDLGGIFKIGNNEYTVGLRLLHISNAGTVPPNYGQNEVFFTLGIRY